MKRPAGRRWRQGLHGIDAAAVAPEAFAPGGLAPEGGSLVDFDAAAAGTPTPAEAGGSTLRGVASKWPSMDELMAEHGARELQISN